MINYLHLVRQYYILISDLFCDRLIVIIYVTQNEFTDELFYCIILIKSGAWSGDPKNINTRFEQSQSAICV